VQHSAGASFANFRDCTGQDASQCQKVVPADSRSGDVVEKCVCPHMGGQTGKDVRDHPIRPAPGQKLGKRIGKDLEAFVVLE